MFPINSCFLMTGDYLLRNGRFEMVLSIAITGKNSRVIYTDKTLHVIPDDTTVFIKGKKN